MEAVQASSADVTSTIRSLGEKSGQIGGIVDTITRRLVGQFRLAVA
jgi:methyl-accepting chemotaxis protein